MTKSAPIQYLQFKQTLAQTGKTYFSLADVEKFYPHRKASLKVLLTRWKKLQYIEHIGQSYYTFDSAQVDYLQLATTIYPESYISFEYALNYYGMIQQVPSTITLASTHRSRRLQFTNWTLEYTHLKSELFFGYELKNKFYIATPEKALIDVLYVMSRGQRLVELDSLNTAQLNEKKIQYILKKFPRYVTKFYKKLSVSQ